MLSLPAEWDYTLKGLSAICGDGVDSISSALKELENAGYVVRKRTRSAQGRLCGIEYIIYQVPQKGITESLESEKKPKRENPVLVETDKMQSAKSENEPAREKPVQVKPKQEKPAQEKRPQSNIQELNIQESSTQSISQSDELPETELDGLTDVGAYLEICSNTLTKKQIRLLVKLMSFVPKEESLSYFQHIYTRLELQANKQKIKDNFAYLSQIIKNDAKFQNPNTKPQHFGQGYGAAYDLQAYENADPFADC